MEPCEVSLLSYGCFLSVSLFFLSTALYGDYKFIQFFVPRTSRKHEANANATTAATGRMRSLFIIGFIYLSVTTILLLYYVIYTLFILFKSCAMDLHDLNKSSAFLVFDTIKDMLYCIQMYGLWLVLFTRLKFIFTDSVYKLSRCTVITYSIILTLIPLPFISMFLPIWSGDLNELGSDVFIVASSLFTFSMMFCVSITILFLYKLCSVYSTERKSKAITLQTDRSLLTVITKYTILALWSLAFNLMACLSWSYSTTGELQHVLMGDVFILLDVYSNLFCTLLTYQFMHTYYLKFCSPFDKCCTSCCGYLWRVKDDKEKVGSKELSSDIDSTNMSNTVPV